MNELITVAHKWFNIGIQLGIEYHVLKSFEQRHKDDPSRCLSETLYCWLKGNAGKSCVKWETIVEALKSPSVHETGLAEKIFEDNQLQPQAAALSEDHPQSIPTPVQGIIVLMAYTQLNFAVLIDCQSDKSMKFILAHNA